MNLRYSNIPSRYDYATMLWPSSQSMSVNDYMPYTDLSIKRALAKIPKQDRERVMRICIAGLRAKRERRDRAIMASFCRELNSSTRLNAGFTRQVEDDMQQLLR